MLVKRIQFPRANVAELIETEIAEPGENEVLVKMVCTAVSAGSERANLVGDLNTEAWRPLAFTEPKWPRGGGYSGSGIVEKVGAKVTRVKVGDRVTVRASCHQSYCVLNENFCYVIPYDDIDFPEAAMLYISTFSLSGMRKTRLEAGESAMVMGLGILGLFAIQFCRAAGAMPVIAVDPIASKRRQALTLGADYALDPTEPDFPRQVKALTDGKGAKVCIEVTGFGKALDQALDCMARHGRVSLLGCTRNSDFSIDYYRKIHYPGIVLIGAHTGTRPEVESRPGYWCYDDEYPAVMRLIHGGRVNFKAMVSELHAPEDCPEVYARLAAGMSFPTGVLFDWRKLDGAK